MVDRSRLEDPAGVRQDEGSALVEQLADFERMLRKAGENLTVLGGVAEQPSGRVADDRSGPAPDQPTARSTRELRMLAVLERWLHAIYVARTQRPA
jgi:hypothetical protein